MPAGILGTDVSVNREFGRLDIQLISDIFADLNLLLATASTGTGRKVMPVFNDGKMRRKRLSPSTVSSFALFTFPRFGSEGFDLLGEIADVFDNSVIEEVLLLTLQ
jgi:hypothetical protein